MLGPDAPRWGNNDHNSVALRLHCFRAAGLPFLPSICSYSSACYACSHAVRSVQPAWQTWSHKQKKQMLSDGSSNPALARSSVFTGIYHLPFVTLCIQAILLQGQLCLISTCNMSSQVNNSLSVKNQRKHVRKSSCCGLIRQHGFHQQK